METSWSQLFRIMDLSFSEWLDLVKCLSLNMMVWIPLSSCNLVVVNLEYFGSRTVCIDSKHSTRIDHEIIFWIDCDAWKDKGYAVLMKWKSLSFPCQRITFVKYFWHQKWWTTNTPHPAQHPRLGPLPRPCVLQSLSVWSNLFHAGRWNLKMYPCIYLYTKKNIMYTAYAFVSQIYVPKGTYHIDLLSKHGPQFHQFPGIASWVASFQIVIWRVWPK